jgi:hypothetical protein
MGVKLGLSHWGVNRLCVCVCSRIAFSRKYLHPRRKTKDGRYRGASRNVLTKCDLGDQIKETGMGGTCGTHVKEGETRGK